MPKGEHYMPMNSKAKTATKTKRKPLYRVTLQVEASQITVVAAKAKEVFGAALRNVEKVDFDKSRDDRLQTVAAEVSTAAGSVEELSSELQEWYDNLPENLRDGAKGDELEEAIRALDEIKETLEAVDFSVEFPSMMG
jgi:chemotaxis protein histidine kinase CheA